MVTVDLHLEIVPSIFHSCFIFRQASLTYAQAQMIIDDPSRTDNVAFSLRSLNSLAKILKKRRIDDG